MNKANDISLCLAHVMKRNGSWRNYEDEKIAKNMQQYLYSIIILLQLVT